MLVSYFIASFVLLLRVQIICSFIMIWTLSPGNVFISKGIMSSAALCVDIFHSVPFVIGHLASTNLLGGGEHNEPQPNTV